MGSCCAGGGGPGHAGLVDGVVGDGVTTAPLSVVQSNQKPVQLVCQAEVTLGVGGGSSVGDLSEASHDGAESLADSWNESFSARCDPCACSLWNRGCLSSAVNQVPVVRTHPGACSSQERMYDVPAPRTHPNCW